MKELWNAIAEVFKEDPIGSSVDLFILIILIGWCVSVIGAMLF